MTLAEWVTAYRDISMPAESLSQVVIELNCQMLDRIAKSLERMETEAMMAALLRTIAESIREQLAQL